MYFGGNDIISKPWSHDVNRGSQCTAASAARILDTDFSMIAFRRRHSFAKPDKANRPNWSMSKMRSTRSNKSNCWSVSKIETQLVWKNETKWMYKNFDHWSRSWPMDGEEKKNFRNFWISRKWSRKESVKYLSNCTLLCSVSNRRRPNCDCGKIW